jgi:hypothetical protein
MLNLQSGSLDWALAHARLLGDTDVFPKAFEFDAIAYCWNEVKAALIGCDVLEWHVRPQRALLAAKGREGFRPVTQLDPLDFLVFASLVRDVGSDIEARRIPAALQRVFSYRFKPTADGRLFDPHSGYSTFVARAVERLDDDGAISHVVVTDIADFYPRIYHHRLENALHAATAKMNHVKALMHLLRGWNGTESYGIPVGSGPSRLLAEATLIDVDESLLANGVDFIRFNDDFRFFAASFDEGYRQLALLADVLYRNHGFTLQREKTAVLAVDEFAHRYLETPSAKEADSLRDKFGTLVNELELSNPYETIDYDALDPEQQQAIDALNLSELLREELDSSKPDYAIVRFIVRRYAQLGDEAAIDPLLEALDDTHPVFPDIVRYLLMLPNLPEPRRHELGEQVIDLLETSVVSELAWHRLWGLYLFSSGTAWDQSDRFVELLSVMTDHFARRKLILALGRAGQRHWFQTHWRNLFEESPWPRRAFLAAASCMPPDARKHWYRSIEDRLDVLELAVVKWARANPFA